VIEKRKSNWALLFNLRFAATSPPSPQKLTRRVKKDLMKISLHRASLDFSQVGLLPIMIILQWAVHWEGHHRKSFLACRWARISSYIWWRIYGNSIWLFNSWFRPTEPYQSRLLPPPAEVSRGTIGSVDEKDDRLLALMRHNFCLKVFSSTEKRLFPYFIFPPFLASAPDGRVGNLKNSRNSCANISQVLLPPPPPEAA